MIEFKYVPVEPTWEMIKAARKDQLSTKEFDYTDEMKYIDIYKSMISVTTSKFGSEGISMNMLADYIADNWPDRKFGLEEICERLSSMRTQSFMADNTKPENNPVDAVVDAFAKAMKVKLAKNRGETADRPDDPEHSIDTIK